MDYDFGLFVWASMVITVLSVLITISYSLVFLFRSVRLLFALNKYGKKDEFLFPHLLAGVFLTLLNTASVVAYFVSLCRLFYVAPSDLPSVLGIYPIVLLIIFVITIYGLSFWARLSKTNQYIYPSRGITKE